MTTTINFNDLATGTVVDNEYTAQGVTVSATGGSGDAMIFDTANPTGGDTDLATSNLGKVLIISEDGNSANPDDNGGGGTFNFAFDDEATVKSLTFLDIEETATITLYAEDGSVIDTIHVPAVGDNGQAVVSIDVAGVASMDVKLEGSGAIDDLVFDAADTGPDYIVEGTSAGELIDTSYTGDPEGDLIDSLDDGGTPASNDDVVLAGGGNDTVKAGDGDDTVYAGSGNDFVLGDDDNAQAGDDLLLGEDGDDTLCGLDGDDTLDGGAGEDFLEGMEGDDLILGGSGDDRAYGDNGNDTIFGDEGGQDGGASVREVFQWDLSPNTGASDFSQDTGNVTVTFTETNGGASDNISTDAQNVSDIDTGTLGSVDGTSSLDSETGGQGNSDTYSLDFSDPVENVSFRVNDIDGDGVVRIQAFDENGDPIEVILEGGSNLTLLDTDGVAGTDTADSNGGYLPDTSDEYSVLVTIPGPVSEIKIFHTQDGSNNSGVNVTDVYFDVPNVGAPEGDGDDTLIGGAGDDLIYGNGGDDSIQGNSGNDTLNGDDPAEGTVVSGNLIFNGSFEITSGMTTTGYGFRADDGNAPGWTDANGDEIDFHNDGRGGVDATDGQNWLDLEASPGNARVGQDVDGVQDGETYRLTFDAGDKSDEPQSGAGENLIEVYWGGELIAVVDPEAGQMDEYTFEVIGGAGDGSDRLEFVGTGDLDNFGASVDNVELVQLAGTPGGGGNDTLEGGTGNDLIDGQGGDDSITGGTGDDTITGGDGADSLSGGDDRDTFIGGNDGDTIDGGTGSTTSLDADDFDVLDLTGEGPFRVINETEDADGNSTSGTIEFLDGAGDPTGETLTFTEIEEIVGDRVNTGPDAMDDDGSGDEDTDITGNVLTNDTDPDLGDTLEVISNTDPSNGSVTIDADGNYTYTPDDDFFGEDSFTYTVSDGNGGEDTATVTLTVNPVQDGPVAEDNAFTVDEDDAAGGLEGNVLTNDSDVDGDTIRITEVSNGTDVATVADPFGATGQPMTVAGDNGGIVTINNAGNTYFDANGDFESLAPGDTAETSVTYTISDNNGGTDTATVTFTVTGVNDDPDAMDDADVTDFETEVEVNLLANDSDVDNDAGDLTVTAATVPAAQGTLTATGTEGVYTFTPADGFEGTATISYTISDGAGGTDSAVHTVEVGADPTPQDGIVDGEESGEEMILGYDDSNLPTDQGGDIITDGDDTIEGNGGDDTINGADGNDDIDGGTGADEIAGGAGDDTLAGGEGDDDIAVGGNDEADGGTGDDVFTVDASDPSEPTDVTIDGGSDGTDGNPDGDENGNEGDVLDLGDQTDDLTVTFETDPEEGTVNGVDADDDDLADITFEEIEKVITGSGNDIIDGTDAEDGIDVETGGGDDDVTGGEGDDTIDGGDGSDTITGGEGSDSIDGGDGDDDIEVGAGDTANGGIGDDVFTVDDTLIGDDPITVDGGSDGTQPGDEAGPENGDDGDTLDLTGLDLVSLVYDETDPTFDPITGVGESGTAVYNNDAGDPVTINFSEIEIVLHDPMPDGAVDGEEDGEDMGPAYDDGLQANDNGGDLIDGADGLDDTIFGNGGDDTINAGLGSDTVSGGTGNDEIFGGASDDADVIGGDEGDDTIQGGGGDDTLDGGTGDDVIEGGTGNDDITGGDGADDVEGGDGNDVIDTSGTAPATDLDTPNIPPFITGGPGDTDVDDDKDTVDGGAGNDTITTGDDADVITGGTGEDVIDGGIDADTIDGGADNDSIIGGEGSDSILGGGGDDTIYGGLDSTAPDVLNVTDDGFNSPIGPDPVDNNGDDFINGGAGNDLIFGQDDNDTIIGGTGDDTIDGGIDDDSITGGQGDDVIEGGHGQDFIQGNNDDDVISGGRGSDTLEGNAGDDTITGGAGDSILGGNDADSIFIDQAEVDENGDADTSIYADGGANGDDNDTLDLTDFLQHRNLVETDDGDVANPSTSGSVEVQNDNGDWVEVTFAEIENLLLPPQAPDLVVDGEETGELMNPLYDDAGQATDGGGDIIDGADGDNDSIRGNGGDDTINAGEGDDTVDGGDDNDSIDGGNGNDEIEGGEGDDTVRGEDGNDTVSGGAGNDSVTGGIGDDVLDGGEGNDSLTGGSGDDTIDGGIGNDTITGSSGADSITDLDGDNEIFSDNPGSFNPDLGTPIGSPAGGFIVVAPDTDPDDNKDTITTGDGNDSIVSGDDADLINAGDGNNTIDAGTDEDTITTGSGDDSIIGGEGNDLINSGAGDDTIDGGVGDPIANFIDEPNPGFFGDPILNNGDDTINAGAGNDVVNGEDDNDVIDGGTGNDTLDGGIDDDTVLGGEGDDVIIGGQGADSLDGGLGDDTFNVGTFTDPNGTGDYVEGIGDTVVGGEDAGDGDIDVLDLSGSVDFNILYEDSIDPTGTSGESGRVVYYTDATKTTVKGELVFKEIEDVIPCFTPGAMIATPRGEVPVETLREGDKVITRDNGIQEIRWTGNRTLNRTELAEGNNLKPILIKAGSLGRNLPERDMLVSPQHRVLITGETPQLYFEESEVLVAAKHLVGKQGVSVMDTMRTTYIHFMFDRHEVVLSDGAWTESFQPGDQTLGAMGEETRAEIIALFPELATEGGLTDYAAARRSLKAHEAKLLQH